MRATELQSRKLFERFSASYFCAYNDGMDEDQPTFKVTDRRLFNADGSPRDLPPEEKPEAKVAVTEEAAVSAAPAEEPVAAEPDVSTSADEPSPEGDEEFTDE